MSNANPLQLLRSNTANKRPDPTALADGRPAVNTNAVSPGLFFKDSAGNLVKVGPVHVGTTAPNASPASGGATGNSLGEQWLDTTGGVYVLKIWDGSAWRSETGTFVDAAGDTMTGALVMDNQQQVRFRETTANGTNYIALQAPASVSSDKTITLPDVTGTVVTTGDTGTVTSAMLADGTVVDADISGTAAISLSKLATGALPTAITVASANIVDGTIVNADVNTSAAIAGTKISPDFGSQTVQTTGIVSHALGTAGAPTVTFTGDTNTGIYSPGADQVAISTNGSQRISVDSNGRLNLAANSQGLRFGTQSNISSAEGAELILNNLGAQPIAFYTNNTERMRLDSSGRLGLGTSSPGATLNVRYDNAGASTVALFENQRSVAGSNDAGQIVVGARTYNNTILRQNSDQGTAAIGGALDTVLANTYSASGFGKLILATQSTPRLTIKESGEVGIGTQTPSFTTDITGTFRVTGEGRFDNGINLKTSTLNYVYYDDAIAFSKNGTGEAFRVDSSRRLLVGTSTSAAVSDGEEPFVQVKGTDSRGGLSLSRFSNDAQGCGLYIAKSRGTSIGSATIVANGDELGRITFSGSDGTDLNTPGASIKAEVDGTPGANDLPTRLVFSTTADGASSPTERMRIDNAGYVMIGATSFAGKGLSLQPNGGIISDYNGTATFTHFEIKNNNGTVGSIQSTGSSTAYNTSSDYRLKENVTQVTDGITRLQQLKPSRFNFIADPTKTVDGFLAHEVQAIVPEAITGEKDAVDNDGNPQYQGIDQSKLVPLLTAALQEAIAKIESLEARLTAAGI